MAQQEFDINVVTTRVRQLILKYKSVQQENDELYAMVEERDEQIKALKQSLSQAQGQYDNLKLAKILEVGDNDLEMAKKRISSLARKVNRCISMLGEEESEIVS